MITPRPDQSERLAFLHLLWELGDVREVRIPRYDRYGRTASGYFDSPELLAEAISRWDGKANVFITLNPVNPALLARSANRIIAKAEDTTSDADVARRRWLFLDIDPVRPSGISSTEAEREAARFLLLEVTDFLTGLGWPPPITVMSGNGYYAIYRIDLPNDGESTALLKEVLGTLAGSVGTVGAHVDSSVYNASRLIGLVGTLKVKGDEMPDRPHRRSQLLSIPDQLEVVSTAQLKSLVGPRAAPRATAARVSSGPTRSLKQMLDEHKIEHREQPPDARYCSRISEDGMIGALGWLIPSQTLLASSQLCGS